MISENVSWHAIKKGAEVVVSSAVIDLAVTTLTAKWNDAVDFSTGVWTDDETAGETGFATSD